MQCGQRGARFVAKSRDAAVAGIQLLPSAWFGIQSVVSPVVISNTCAQLAVSSRTSKLFNPRVFVGRDSLGGKLAADPIRFFGHDDAHAIPRRRQGCRTTAQPTANNHDVRFSLSETITMFCNGPGCNGLQRVGKAGKHAAEETASQEASTIH